MTPQERCEFLLIKYYSAHGPNLPFQTAKQCAIICVEQIISAVGTVEDQVYEWDRRPHEDFKYWQEVLIHLQNS